MTASIPSTTTPPSAEKVAESQKSRTKLAGNLDTFLKLLTSQLKHQDPTAPMDATQFTNQLVQFANVEQSINTNTNLEKMIGLYQQGQMVSAASYIGNRVTAESDQVPLQDGKADFSYNLADAATKAQITITDASGKIVHKAQAALDAGDHSFSWDGKDASGTQLPDGVYSVSIAAIDKENEPVETKILSSGVVAGVEFTDGSPILDVGGVKISIDKVLSLKRSQPSAA